MKKSTLLILIISTILLVSCAIPVQQAAPSQAPAQQQEQAATIGATVTSAPTSVQGGEKFQISWRVQGTPKTIISHTAIQYDTESHPGSLGLDVIPPKVGYKQLTTEYVSGQYYLPSTFMTTIAAPKDADMIYFRAYAIINGENYWSPEQSIKILKGSESQSASSVKSFTILANDKVASPNALTVAKGTHFFITFTVDTTDVYHAGLDFKSSIFNSPSVKPGTSWTTPELTADASFKISAYWPTTDIKKWDLPVTVS